MNGVVAEVFEVMAKMYDVACRRELPLNAPQIGNLSRESPHAAQEEWHRERTLPEAKATAGALPLR